MRRRWGWWERTLATVAMLIAGGLVGLLAATVIHSFNSQATAVRSLQASRELAARRVDKLTDEIGRLSRENAVASRQRGKLLAEIHALDTQLRELGIQPVASEQPSRSPAGPRTREPTARPSTTPVPRPTRSKPSPSPSPHPTRAPQPSPTPTPCLVLGLICR